MGAVCTTPTNDTKVTESDDSAYLTHVDDSQSNHPAPITVNLSSPEVDVAAPIDERDIELVQQTFARVALLGAGNVGIVVFGNIFEIAPGALQLFPFKDDPNYATNGVLKKHGANVVSTVGVAVSMLRDLPNLVPVLQALGTRHVGYSVIPAHYDVVGQALIKSLATALGPKFTEPVKNAYLKVYTTVKAVMCGDHYKEAEAAAAAAAEAPAEVAPAAGAAADEAKAEPSAQDAKKSDEAQMKKDAEAKKRAADAKKKKEELLAKKTAEAEKKKKAEAEAKKKAEADAKVAEALNAKKERAAKFKEMDKEAKTALIKRLIEGARNGQAYAVKKALEDGCDVDVVDNDGTTALHYAAWKGHTEIARMLLQDWGAEISPKVGKGEWGFTPLHLACRHGFEEVVKLVFSTKSMHNNNFVKKGPIELAEDKGFENVAKLVKKLEKAAKPKK